MENRPLISVVICTYNRCASLKKTLDSFVEQICDKRFDFEIIVVDNNSEDQTKTSIEAYFSQFNTRLRYIFEQAQGVSYARNRGIRESKGDIIAFTDDDCIVKSDWLCNIADAFTKHDCAAMGGKVIPVFLEDTPRWLKGKFTPLGIARHDYGEILKFYTTDMFMPIGCNLAIRKNTLIEVGLFNTNIGAGTPYWGEDGEIVERMLRNGKKILYLPSAIVYHPLRFENLRREFYYGWYEKYGRTHVKKMNIRNKISMAPIIMKIIAILIITIIKYLRSILTVANNKFYYETRIFYHFGEFKEALFK